MPQTDKDQNGTQEAARTESVKTDKTDATTTSNPVITIPVLTQILFPEAKSTVNKDDAQLQNLKVCLLFLFLKLILNPFLT